MGTLMARLARQTGNVLMLAGVAFFLWGLYLWAGPAWVLMVSGVGLALLGGLADLKWG
jgi:hypothetical protein